MIIERVYDHLHGWYWLAQGEGPLRPIIAEGGTRDEARKLWNQTYGEQYAQEQSLTEQSLRMERHIAKNREDYRQLAAECRALRGE